MFQSSHYIHMPNRHRQRTALRTFFPSSSFSPPDSKEPLRRGILLSSVASVLLLVGGILTWLEFNGMFGGKISMTGPVLIAVALLMMLLSLRQFRLAHKRNRTNNGPLQLESVSAGGVTALVVDQEEGVGPTTVVVDSWEEAGCDHDVIRVNEDLAPPSYTDLAQLSCSSNCPSFVSHDDRNEAPPTYEETCGMYSYGSESSLGQFSRRCSSQLEASPSPRGACQGFFQQDPLFNNRTIHGHPPLANSSQTPCSSNSLSPGSALLISAWQRNMQKGVKSDLTPCEVNEMSSNVSISSEETVATVDPCQASKSEHADSQPALVKGVERGQRSFSSIPSYTCLLSESGEVSAEVYNTSSIISQMLPNESASGATFDSFLGALTGPTRSHSTSSINNLRQGVPYNLTSSSTNIHSTARASKADSPSIRRRSEGSRPGEEINQGRRNTSCQRSDSNVHSEMDMASLPLVIPTSSPKGNNTGSSPSPEIPPQEKAANVSSGNVSQVSAVRERPNGGHEVLLLNTQDVQETI